MSPVLRVSILGFSAFERSTLASYFRLATQRPQRYELEKVLSESDYVIADSEHGPSVQLVRATERLADTVFVGARRPADALAYLPRPFDPEQVLRELDAMVRRRATTTPLPIATAVAEDWEADGTNDANDANGINDLDDASGDDDDTVAAPLSDLRPASGAGAPGEPPATDGRRTVAEGAQGREPGNAAARSPGAAADRQPPAPAAPKARPAAASSAAFSAAGGAAGSPAEPTPSAPSTSAAPSAPPAARAAALRRPHGPWRAARRLDVAANEVPTCALVVDDSEIVSRFLQSRLSACGIDVKCAEVTDTAVRLLGGPRFDLVFLDMSIGEGTDMDALALCREIKRQLGGTSREPMSVVLMTRGSDESDRVRGMLAGADAFLTKPLKEADLQRLLERHGLRTVGTPSPG